MRARGRRRARPVGPGLKVSGYFVASLCLAEGHRDPGTFFGREGALSLPPQVPFSHTRPAPGFFFMGIWGPACTQDCSDACTEFRIPSAAPRIPRNSLRNPGYEFLLILGGNAVRFFTALCFGKSP